MRVCLFGPDPAWLTGEADLMEVCRGAAEAKALQPEVDSEPVQKKILHMLTLSSLFRLKLSVVMCKG